MEFDAYEGLKSALQKTPAEVLDLVEESGLQGRGGAGFPVGRKWKFVASEKRSPRYIICNADESEPLIFKDRVLIDTNPHQLLEGMTIGGYACGASEAWIYIRGEYEYQAQRLERAIQQAEEKGYLGENILDSGFSFKIHVHRGAGAYICGEETALIESLEGKRGEPRLRPPYPPSYGFRGQPTAVNNVESFAAVPHIAQKRCGLVEVTFRLRNTRHKNIYDPGSRKEPRPVRSALRPDPAPDHRRFRWRDAGWLRIQVCTVRRSCGNHRG